MSRESAQRQVVRHVIYRGKIVPYSGTPQGRGDDTDGAFAAITIPPAGDPPVVNENAAPAGDPPVAATATPALLIPPPAATPAPASTRQRGRPRKNS